MIRRLIRAWKTRGLGPEQVAPPAPRLSTPPPRTLVSGGNGSNGRSGTGAYAGGHGSDGFNAGMLSGFALGGAYGGVGDSAAAVSDSSSSLSYSTSSYDGGSSYGGDSGGGSGGGFSGGCD